MLVNMLKATRKMLEKPISPKKVECAIAVLDEVIANLEANPTYVKTYEFTKYPKTPTTIPGDNPLFTNEPTALDEELSPEAMAAKEELTS